MRGRSGSQTSDCPAQEAEAVEQQKQGERHYGFEEDCPADCLRALGTESLVSSRLISSNAGAFVRLAGYIAPLASYS